MLKAANESGAGAEGEAVSDEAPNDGYDAHHGEALHHSSEDVLFADEATIVESQSWAGHEQDKSGAYKHPRVVGRHLSVCDLGLQLCNLIGRSSGGGLSKSGNSAKKKTETTKKGQLDGTSLHNAPHGHF
jgi:hypothetical protein